MPTVMRIGPYRFFFYSGIGRSRVTSTWNVTTRRPSSGWIQCDWNEALDSAVRN